MMMKMMITEHECIWRSTGEGRGGGNKKTLRGEEDGNRLHVHI
jgi:hypothetical protein